MENSTDQTCVVCGQAEGKPFDCITYHAKTTIYRKRRKQLFHKHKTTYFNVERHTGCVCDACRQKCRSSRLKDTIILMGCGFAAFVVCILILKNTSGGPLLGLAAIGFIPCGIFAFIGLKLVFEIKDSDFGSETLGIYCVEMHRKLYPEDREYHCATIKDAKSKGLIE